MTTVVVYKTDTKEVLAAIPMDGGDAVCGMMWNFRFTTEQSQYSRKLPEESYWQKTNL